jgi:hypothetical protein
MPGILDQFIMHTVLDHLSRKTDAKTPMPVVVVHDATKGPTPGPVAVGPMPKPPAVVGAVRRALGVDVSVEVTGSAVGYGEGRDTDGLSIRTAILVEAAPYDNEEDRVTYVLAKVPLNGADDEILRQRLRRLQKRRYLTHRNEFVSGTRGARYERWVRNGRPRAYGVRGDEGRFGYSDTLNEAPSKTLSSMPSRLVGAVRGDILGDFVRMS